MIFVICQTAPLEEHNNNNNNNSVNNYNELYNQYQALTAEQLADLDEFLSRKISEEYASSSVADALDRNTRRPDQLNR